MSTSTSLNLISSLLTFPLVGALTIGTKVAYLIPLLIEWNSASSPHKLFLGGCSKPRSDGPIERVGIHQVAVHDVDVARQILKGDVKVATAGTRTSGTKKSVVSREHMVVRGCKIPAGTLIVLDDMA